MAEQFIEEIYSKAKLLSIYKRCIRNFNINDLWSVSKLWTPQTAALLDVVNQWSSVDPESATRLGAYAKLVSDSISDPYKAADAIENGILPLLGQYLSMFGGIDVTDDGWQIKSTVSGLLTLYDIQNNRHLHSLNDPLWQAWEEANSIYEGKYETVVIMGNGLGYLAYQLWEKSCHSIHLVIYENDLRLVNYAHNYGVLDWIDPDYVEIHVIEDMHELAQEFTNTVLGRQATMGYISDWMLAYMPEELKGSVWSFIENSKATISFKDYYDVNYWRNRNNFEGDFCPNKMGVNYKDYIVVAAGPSLDDNIDFLKDNQGKKGIIAVNTVVKRLYKEGIKSDFVCLADPTDGVYRHIEGMPEATENIPLVAEAIAYWKFIEDYRGPVYRVIADDHPLIEREVKEQGLDVWNVGATVTSFAIETAIRLGAQSIYLVGADLGFPGDKFYAGDSGNVQNKGYVSDNMVRANDGGLVKTAETFNKFRSDIEIQLRKSSGAVCFNMSEHGSRIQGTVSGKWLHACLEDETLYRKITDKNNPDSALLSNLLMALSDLLYEGAWGIPAFMSFDASGVEDKNKFADDVRSLRNIAEKMEDTQAVIFLDSVLAALIPNSDAVKKSIEFICDDASLTYLQKYFLYRQYKHKPADSDGISSTDISDAMDSLYQNISENFEKAYAEASTTMPEIRINLLSNFAFVICDEFDTDILDEHSKNIANSCKQILKKGKSVILVNTNEATSMAGILPFYNMHVGGNKEVPEFVYISGKQVPYINCDNGIPEINAVVEMTQIIAAQHPFEIINATNDSLFMKVLI